MADITNPGATRDHGAAAHVRSGMELLSWRYPPGEWQRHRQARSRRRWLGTLMKARERNPAVMRWSTVVAIVVGGGFGIGAIAAAAADSLVGVGVTSLGLVGTVVGAVVSSRRRRHSQDAVDPPEVLFTSTGVIFGEHARRWRGYRYSLSDARVRFGELTHLEPAYLELEFSTGWPNTTMSIPVPSVLERDTVELAVKLENMMLGRALVRNSPAVTSEDLEER